MKIEDHVEVNLRGLFIASDQESFERAAERSGEGEYVGGWQTPAGSLVVAMRTGGATYPLVIAERPLLTRQFDSLLVEQQDDAHDGEAVTFEIPDEAVRAFQAASSAARACKRDSFCFRPQGHSGDCGDTLDDPATAKQEWLRYALSQAAPYLAPSAERPPA